jgi:hypothetical protein
MLTPTSLHDENYTDGHSGRWWSLWEMMQFKGESFYKLSQLLSVLTAMEKGTALGLELAFKALAEHIPNFPRNLPLNYDLPMDAKKGIQASVLKYRPHLVNAALTTSIKSFDRFIAQFDEANGSYSELADSASELHMRIRDELEETNLWQVMREHIKFLGVDTFGFVEQKTFQEAHRDIEEAGKCLAFDRGTASVFHLMRVMEVGLRALGRSLADETLNPKTNPTWEKILRRCDEELRKPLSSRSPEWRADEQFFSTATANLRAVKDAWRNPSIHVELSYDPETAVDIWNAVRAFMRHLATKLSA